MKEHFSPINPGDPRVSGHRDLAKMHESYKKNRPEEAAGDGSAKAQEAPVREDEAFKLDTQGFRRQGQVGDNQYKEVAEMNLKAATEAVNFIRNLAQTPEGRELLSKVHDDVNPQQLIRIFGES